MPAPEGIQTTCDEFPVSRVHRRVVVSGCSHPTRPRPIGWLPVSFRRCSDGTTPNGTEAPVEVPARHPQQFGLRFDSKCLQPPVCWTRTMEGTRMSTSPPVTSWPCSSQEVTSMFSTGTVVNKLLSLALAVSLSYCARPSFGRAALVAWSPNGT